MVFDSFNEYSDVVDHGLRVPVREKVVIKRRTDSAQARRPRKLQRRHRIMRVLGSKLLELIDWRELDRNLDTMLLLERFDNADDRLAGIDWRKFRSEEHA